MAVQLFPGNLRIGVLDEVVTPGRRPPVDTVDPKFQIMVLLKGYQRFSIDDHQIELDAREHPVAMMMHLRRTAKLHYDISYGAPYRKIALATPSEWLHQLTASGDTVAASLCKGSTTFTYHIWSIDTELTRLATQILLPPPQDNATQKELFRISRALELIRRALTDCINEPAQSPSDAHPIAERIRLYLLRNLSQDLTLDRIEKDLGMNRRSLQRHFKTGTGITLSDFMRRERLVQARRALSEDGFTVAQAAHIAGYSTPENFSTAFRHAFGHPPQTMRNCAI
ncbi:AraC-like DNA-binding protein [Yoonia maritima]|uniref:AraC-like DNA-binding protein n=1 Tax=Yoonia maritima TaxID=1435347 RepID=A0A2T0VZJ5_9RHOB|nr:AraC family transcriptional regulator [Yoonia maritima]PRY77736.1 AraC-like DNA-binding protein [Yoonia maritima]